MRAKALDANEYELRPGDAYTALDGAQQREPLRLRPGIHLIGGAPLCPAAL